MDEQSAADVPGVRLRVQNLADIARLRRDGDEQDEAGGYRQGCRSARECESARSSTVLRSIQRASRLSEGLAPTTLVTDAGPCKRILANLRGQRSEGGLRYA